MNEYDFGSHDRSQKRKAHRNFDDKNPVFIDHGRTNFFQSISTGAPLPRILNGICSALDCQIGDVVSLISLPGDDASELAAIAMNAALFGLYTFSSEGVVAENNELLDRWRYTVSFHEALLPANFN